MSEVMNLEGQCMCGAVTITATSTTPVLRACHCQMCRRHTSSMFVSIQTDPDSIQIAGPEKVFKSSEWAQRAFCAFCGSTLWYGMQHDGSRNLAAGLFDGLNGVPMVQEYFADQCPSGYAIAGDHEKLTREETFALFAPNDGDGA